MADGNTITSQIQILDDIAALDNVINRVDNLIQSMERLERAADGAFGGFNNVSNVSLPEMPEIPEQNMPITQQSQTVQ